MQNRDPIGPNNNADAMRRQPSALSLLLKFVGLVCTICFASAAFAQNRYQITRLPMAQGANSVALGINNKGEVVGYSFQGEDYQAFLYSSSDQSLTDVGSLGGKINAACAVNDAGQVIGYSQDGSGNLLAFIFSRSQPMASLGTLEGASTSEAFGINNSGAVVGDSQSGNQNHRPVLFSNGSVRDLGLGGSNEPDAIETAYAINAAGQIVGRHQFGSNAFHAFSYLNGNKTDFSTLGGANGEALAINENGLVVGDSDTADGPAHAFVLDHSQLKDLGTLPGFEAASYARGINNSGDIVGESDSADQKRAFLYANGQLVELDKLAENLSQAGFNSLDVAYGINAKGWIVGYGTATDNLTAAFLAVPEGRGSQGQAGPPSPQTQYRGQEQPVSQSNEENYDVFYTRLSSDEGSWVEAGNYGYCFRPRVAGDWRPYRDGHWVWTDRGWYWDSNERFAWATYHYGRWVNIGGTGWCWVPGNQWAPAWVSWRESDENVGWAPLPPEADVSVNRSISSWSDSFYGIGPAAYTFINYAHWHEPSYAQYIESPERNAQFISQSKNVTNIVTNNNIINNFGPPVQTVATKTNQNIQQVRLSLNPGTDPHAKYGQTLQGNQLNVVAPGTSLKPQATHAPTAQNRIENPQVEKGWQGVQPQDAEKLKKTIAEQNPPPKDLAKPTPFVNPQIGNKGEVTGSSGAGQKAPANLVKPGASSPNANAIPGTSANAPTAGRKLVPPNLLGTKPSGMPGRSPTESGGKPTAPASPGLKQTPSGNVPGASPIAPKGTPPNLNVPRPSATPALSGSERNQPIETPPPKPMGNPPLGQNRSPTSTTPRPGVTPTQERKPETAPTPTAHSGPANLTTPKPTSTPHQPPNQEAPKPNPEVKEAPREISTPRPIPVSTPHREPVDTSKPAPESKVSPLPRPEIKAPPQAEHTPVPQAQAPHTPPAQPQAPKPALSEQQRQPQGGQKHEPAKPTPTPTP
jgi:probable HAF family extracellular repeat protein